MAVGVENSEEYEGAKKKFIREMPALLCINERGDEIPRGMERVNFPSNNVLLFPSSKTNISKKERLLCHRGPLSSWASAFHSIASPRRGMKLRMEQCNVGLLPHCARTDDEIPQPYRTKSLVQSIP